MSKWFCQIEKGYMGLYCCELYINGQLNSGIPDDLTYNELRAAVRNKTGIVLPLCKSLIWQKDENGKFYAFIDNTQPCPNGSIVTLKEIKAGHRKLKIAYPPGLCKFCVIPVVSLKCSISNLSSRDIPTR